MSNTKESFSDLLDVVEELTDLLGDIPGIELYKLAVGIQRNKIEAERNKIFTRAFVTDTISGPSALEAIAMQLGYKGSTMIGGDLVSLFKLKNDE